MGPRVLIISRVQLEIYLELISRGHYNHDEVLNFCCVHLLCAVPGPALPDGSPSFLGMAI
jgi:hypothetical protein